MFSISLCDSVDGNEGKLQVESTLMLCYNIMYDTYRSLCSSVSIVTAAGWTTGV
jgi:hypothetical protein